MMRIVLPDSTSRDAIDDAAHAMGLLLVNIVPKTDTYPSQVIYVSPDRRAAVHLVDEGKGGALCFMVRAEGDDGPAIEARWQAKIEAAMNEAST